MPGKIVFAAASARVLSGHQVVVGEAWDADDPVVKACPSLFTDDDRFVRTTTRKVERAKEEAPVEQATKAPGEKRTTRRD